MAEEKTEPPGNVTANALEILLPFLVAVVIMWGGWSVVGDRPFARQAVVFAANLAMLLVIGIGLRARRQTWGHLGLGLNFSGKRALLRAVFQSVAVLVFAVAAFVAGSALGSKVAPAQPHADMSGYEYLHGNLPMLFVALVMVYIVSSFGEEVVYRGFLMTRVAEMGKGTRTAWAAAVLVSALVFGLAHFGWGAVGIVQTTLMGVALSVSWLLVRRNLWVLVLAHAYMDTLLLVQLYVGAGAAAG